jgi:hypothetical protein
LQISASVVRGDDTTIIERHFSYVVLSAFTRTMHRETLLT